MRLLALRFYGSTSRWPTILAANPGGKVTTVRLSAANEYSLSEKLGKCVWIPWIKKGPGCNYGRADQWWKSPADLYKTFDSITRYMTNQMNRNRDYLYAKYPVGIYRINAAGEFIGRVSDGSSWDHKKLLKSWYGRGKDFWTAVRNDPAPETLKYDVWSNIHYGYVGRSIGMPEGLLFAGQALFGGNRTDSDDEAVRIGFDLWSRYGRYLPTDGLRRAVTERMPKFRRFTDKGVKIPLATVQN